jgi:hypothetical protein
MTTPECPVKCKMCDKKGLPILLTRYAIAPKEANAPALSGDFAITPAIDSGTDVTYTQRLLRPGYLYQYDEARKKWQGYLVTEDAYFMPFMLPKKNPHMPVFRSDNTPLTTIDPKTQKLNVCAPGKKVGAITPDGCITVPDAAAIKAVPCAPEKNGLIAGCVTIPEAEKAGIVWFAFSDVEWTEAVFQRHQDAAYRARHMRAFNVATWLGGKHPHACNAKAVAETVADYHDNLYKDRAYRDHITGHIHDSPPKKSASAIAPVASFVFQKDHFSWSNAPLQKRCHAQGNKLIQAFDKLYPDKGAILALDDPAGIVIDLAGLSTALAVKYGEATQNAHERELKINDIIVAMREEMRNANVSRTLDASKSAMPPGGVGISAHGKSLSSMRRPPDDSLERAHQGAWAKYEDKYNEAERDKFMAKIRQDAEDFNKKHIIPLSRAHVAWMTSKPMEEYFSTNFDRCHAGSGDAYVAQVSACIGNTQAYPDSQALYDKWLDGKLDDPGNFLLRAFVCNQDEYAEKIKPLLGKPLEVFDFDMPPEEEEIDGSSRTSRYASRTPDEDAQRAGREAVNNSAIARPKTTDLISAVKGLTTNPVKAVGKVLKGENSNALGYLMMQVSGTLTKHIERAVISLNPSSGLAAANAMSGAHFVVVNGSMTGKQLINRVTQGMYGFLLQHSDAAVWSGPGTRYMQAIDKMEEIFRIQMGDAYNKAIHSGRFGVDLVALKKILDNGKNMTDKQLAVAFSKTFYSIEAVKGLPASWSRADAIADTQKAAGVVGNRFALGASVLGGLFSFAALGAAITDMEKADKLGAGQFRATSKLYACWLGMAGAIGDLVEKAPAPGLNIPFAKRLSEKWVKVFRFISKAGGIGASLISAVLDFKGVVESYKKRDLLLAGLYLASGPFGSTDYCVEAGQVPRSKKVLRFCSFQNF